jgi:hypothetical protein
MKTAHVRVRLDGAGNGEVVLNGIHIGHLVQSTRLTSKAGEGTIVQLDILADLVEVEGTDVQIVLNELRPEDPGPLQHDIVMRHDLPYCQACRMYQGNPMFPAVCPGVPEWAKKGTQQTS